MQREKMRVVDLFAGCGGLSKGFENAGFQLVGAFEFWNAAAECYRQNFNHPVFSTDLSQISTAVQEISALDPEVIIGGPPCQDFSHAGKRIEASRASLTEAYANIIKEISPKYFLMENVDRAQKSHAYSSARNIFKNAGYGLTEIVLDASFCGVPQRRKRFFCMGIKGKDDGFALNLISQNLSSKEMTLRDYFGNSLGFEYYYRHPRNYDRRAIFSIDEPSPTIRGVNRPVPKGYPGHPHDACILNEEIRALTLLERALIQTFPVDFKWVGSKTEIEQMIGNAVPVKLAEFVAKILKSFIEDNSPQYLVEKSTFLSWIGQRYCYSERTLCDIYSRLQRAFRILPPQKMVDDFYLYQLEKCIEFQHLSSSVRSQIRKAISLLIDYNQSSYLLAI